MIKQILTDLAPLLALPAGMLAAVRIPGIGTFGFVNGSGNVVERDVPVSNFKRVRLAGIGNLHVEQCDEEALHVQCEDNIFEMLRIEVVYDELHIGFEHAGPVRPSKPLHFYLKAKTMEGICISGAGDCDTGNLKAKSLELNISGSGSMETGTLDVGDLDMKISGSGDLELGAINSTTFSATISGRGDIETEEVKTDNATLKISGSGNVRLKDLQAQEVESKVTGHGNIQLGGKVESHEIKISGSGEVKAFDLVSQSADVGISGIGQADLNVAEVLNARVSGSGKVQYRGQPRVDMKASGIGKIIQVRD